MEIIFLSFFTAFGALIIVVKAIGLHLLMKTQVIWDVLFTIGVPMLFIGTFSGMATAIVSGVMFSIMVAFITFCHHVIRKPVVGMVADVMCKPKGRIGEQPTHTTPPNPRSVRSFI